MFISFAFKVPNICISLHSYFCLQSKSPSYLPIYLTIKIDKKREQTLITVVTLLLLSQNNIILIF